MDTDDDELNETYAEYGLYSPYEDHEDYEDYYGDNYGDNYNIEDEDEYDVRKPEYNESQRVEIIISPFETKIQNLEKKYDPYKKYAIYIKNTIMAKYSEKVLLFLNPLCLLFAQYLINEEIRGIEKKVVLKQIKKVYRKKGIESSLLRYYKLLKKLSNTQI